MKKKYRELLLTKVICNFIFLPFLVSLIFSSFFSSLLFIFTKIYFPPGFHQKEAQSMKEDISVQRLRQSQTFRSVSHRLIHFLITSGHKPWGSVTCDPSSFVSSIQTLLLRPERRWGIRVYRLTVSMVEYNSASSNKTWRRRYQCEVMEWEVGSLCSIFHFSYVDTDTLWNQKCREKVLSDIILILMHDDW